MSPASRHSPRVFVTVGTHEQGFPRLLDAAAQASAEGFRASWQLQHGPAGPGRMSVDDSQESLSHAEMRAALDAADVVISQASPGNVFGALEHLTQAIVMPRQHALGEHVDDHQQIFAEYCARVGLARVAHGAADLKAELERVAAESVIERRERLHRARTDSRTRTRAWNQSFGNVVTSLMQESQRKNRRSLWRR